MRIERSWQAISDGEMNSSTWWTVRTTSLDDALVAQVQRRVGRDAVLRVDDVEAAVGEQRAQALAVGRDHREDALVEGRLGGDVLDELRRRPAAVARKNASPGWASAADADLVTAPRQRLGDRERVLDAAARLDRVGQHRDLHAATSAGAIARSARRVAAALDGATIAPASRRIFVWRAASWGSPFVPQTRASTTALLRGGGDRVRQARRRVGVPAVAEHDVEQHAADVLVLGRLLEEAEPHVEVDHRVRAALRVLLLAEVEHGVAAVALVGAVADVALQRAELGLEQRDRLVGQRAAGEQAEQAPSGGALARGVDGGLELAEVLGIGARRGARGGLERVVDLERRLVAVALPADEGGDDALALGQVAGQRGDDLRRGRLGDEQQRLGLVVGGEHVHRLAEHDPADVGRQVAPADADDLRHADAGRVEQAGRLLGAGAGGGDDADRAGRDDVREAETDVAEHRGPAAGAHDEQPELLRRAA